MQFDLNNFTTLKPQPVAGRQKPTVPLVSLTRTGITFNSYIMNNSNVIKQFVQVRLDPGTGKMAFVFSDERVMNSYKVSIPEKRKMFAGTVTIGARSVIKYLNEETDLINTDIFRYRFKAEISEGQSAVMIDLRNPYRKTRKSTQGGARHE